MRSRVSFNNNYGKYKSKRDAINNYTVIGKLSVNVEIIKLIVYIMSLYSPKKSLVCRLLQITKTILN